MWINLDDYKHRPLFLSDLQEKIEALSAEQKQQFKILLTVDAQGRHRKLEFVMPRGILLTEYESLFERYLLAMIDNVLVSFGGASMVLFLDISDEKLVHMAKKTIENFDLDAPKNNRKGYGVHINYINRMNTFLGLDRFKLKCSDLHQWKEPDPSREYRIYAPQDEKAEIKMLRRTATELDGKTFCSLDVGGNSIKGAVVTNGQIVAMKEFQWYPTCCKTACEMNDPQLLMLRFLSDYSVALENKINVDDLANVLHPSASYFEVSNASQDLENAGVSPFGRFDAIVIGFPDIVVFNKIAGGESFKHQGMKNNTETDYETEFFKTSNLDKLAKAYVKEGGPVFVLNDGNAASYVTSVDLAFSDENEIEKNGMFANTIGTEMGTGFISRGGTIQHIPLEGFQHIIDLGNTAYAVYPVGDIRSTRNMNTGIPGTVQKYISQLGLFRIAMSAFYEEDPEFIRKLVNMGLIEYDFEADEMKYVTSPKDRRGDLTFLLINMLTKKNHAVENAFRTMGKTLGVLIDQDVKIFPEISTKRLLSGGIVSSDIAFNLLREELQRHNPTYDVFRLDEETVYSPLLKRIPPGKRNFNVAVGSAYIGNRFILE